MRPQAVHGAEITGLEPTAVLALQRAAGILPSRRTALLQLMELQTRLEREQRFAEAAVCTNAVLTLQELLQRVEELRHTV